MDKDFIEELNSSAQSFNPMKSASISYIQYGMYSKKNPIGSGIYFVGIFIYFN